MGVSSIDTPFLNKIEKLNSGTNAYKELKLKSANASEFFGLAQKTGVTTRMFGSNSIWGKITAYFGFDTTAKIKIKVRDELKKNVTKIINYGPLDKLKKEELIKNLNEEMKKMLIDDHEGIHLTPKMVMDSAEIIEGHWKGQILLSSILPDPVPNNSNSSKNKT